MGESMREVASTVRLELWGGRGSSGEVRWVGVQALVESCLAPSVSLHNIHYAK